AATIVAAARERGLTLAKVEHFASDAGMGVRGRVDGHQLILGNASLMRREQVDIESQALRANVLGQYGASVMYLAVDRKLAGL
ncbi:hypothetical protein ABTE19_22285, partial [Acinetobacter baumannii]